MPTKTARMDYNELLSGYVTLQTQINPPPGTCSKGSEAMLRCFREEEEKTRVHVKIYESQFCLLTILMDTQIQNQCSNAAVSSVALLCISLSLSLSLSLWFRSSAQWIHLFSHSYEKRYTVMAKNIGTLGKYEQRQLWKWICIVYPFYLSLKKFTQF